MTRGLDTPGDTTNPEPPQTGISGQHGNGASFSSTANEEISQSLDQSIKIGALDANGYTITYVYSRTRKYIIYESDRQLRYLLPENYSAASILRTKVACLGGLRSSIENLRSEPCLSDLEARRAGLEMAWAIGLAFDDTGSSPSDQPKEILKRIDDRLRSLIKSHFRKQYAFANLKAFGAIEFILLLFAFSLSSGVQDASRIALLHYAIFGMFGTLGAFLSVIAGINSIDIDINLGPWEHIFAGATRIMIGLIGAWVVSLALDSSLIDPTFGNKDAAPLHAAPIGFPALSAMHYIFAFIGGFSQTLVPNLLKRGEEATGAAEHPNTASNGPIVKGMRP